MAAVENLHLWYDKPAGRWTEALPLGNGRQGAMVFGGIYQERIGLNDDTLWSGEPGQNDHFVDIHQNGIYQEVMALLAGGDYEKAHEMIQQNWMGRVVNCYQPLGDLCFELAHVGDVSQYRRSLSLAEALCSVTYQINEITYQREYFTSAPEQLVGVRFSASKPNSLSLKFSLDSVHPHRCFMENDQYWMLGQVPGQAIRYPFDQLERYKGNRHQKYPEVFNEDGSLRDDAAQVKYGEAIQNRGIRFATAIRFRVEGGNWFFDGETVVIENTNTVEVYLASGSSFSGFDRSPSEEGKDERQEARQGFANIGEKSWESLRDRAVADHSALFRRVSLQIGKRSEACHLPTDERIRRFDGVHDLGLISLLLQYGRYLMICGSRPGTQALNLQGIWNEQVLPPWASNYTLNINTEMNYWPAETCNLAECAEPLFDLIRELAVKGTEVATKTFDLPGWTASHNSDIWRVANPVEGNPLHSFWPMGGGWLCEHLWEHFLFTNDREFLEQCAYPLMEGAAQFINAWLVKNENGFWVTAIGTSPENYFSYMDGSGTWQKAAMSSGPTMDMAITRELFTNLLAAAAVLERKSPFLDEIGKKLPLLLPNQVGKYGQLMEWAADFEEPEPHHRHTSHLYGVYPGNQITESHQALIMGVKETLRRRGDESTGWAKGWRICLWARLLDGNHAHKMISSLLTLVETDGKNPNYSGGGGVYANLFDAHPPFQIDGNFGATAGIAEMLLQSQNGEIHLLPALPDAWESGSVTGLKARGGYEAAIDWENNRLSTARIHAAFTGKLVLRYMNQRIEVEAFANDTVTIQLADFQS